MRLEVEPIEMGMDDLEALLERAKSNLSPEDLSPRKTLSCLN